MATKEQVESLTSSYVELLDVAAPAGELVTLAFLQFQVVWLKDLVERLEYSDLSDASLKRWGAALKQLEKARDKVFDVLRVEEDVLVPSRERAEEKTGEEMESDPADDQPFVDAVEEWYAESEEEVLENCRSNFTEAEE
jgi:hypothetical protein